MNKILISTDFSFLYMDKSSQVELPAGTGQGTPSGSFGTPGSSVGTQTPGRKTSGSLERIRVPFLPSIPFHSIYSSVSISIFHVLDLSLFFHFIPFHSKTSSIWSISLIELSSIPFFVDMIDKPPPRPLYSFHSFYFHLSIHPSSSINKNLTIHYIRASHLYSIYNV